MEERTISAQITSAAPNAGTGRELRPSVLPEFVTPDWLRENHHLMKADLRKLAAAIGEDYPDWPEDADGGDEAAFWRAAHAFAERWTWFPWLFEACLSGQHRHPPYVVCFLEVCSRSRPHIWWVSVTTG